MAPSGTAAKTPQHRAGPGGPAVAERPAVRTADGTGAIAETGTTGPAGRSRQQWRTGQPVALAPSSSATRLGDPAGPAGGNC